MPESPFESDHWRGRTWELSLYNPAPGVLYTRVMGHADLECVHHLMRAFDRVASLTPDRVEAFHDWERISGYDAEVRPVYTRWSQGHPERIGALHILVRSRIVAMGITVANVALGGVMTAHNDRAEFEKVRAEAILRRRRLADAGPASGPMSSRSPASGPISARAPVSRPITIPPPSGPISTLPSSDPGRSWPAPAPASGPISGRRGS